MNTRRAAKSQVVVLSALAIACWACCGGVSNAADPLPVTYRLLFERDKTGVHGITFSRDGRFTKVHGSDKIMEVWDLARCRQAFQAEDVMYTGWQRRGDVAFGRKKDAYVYFSPTGKTSWSLPVLKDRVVCGTHCWWAVTREPAQGLVLWDLLNGKQAGRLGHPNTDLRQLTGVHMTGGKVRVTGTLADHSIVVWPVEQPSTSVKVGPHHGAAWQVVFSRDRSRVLTRGPAGAVVWDAVTGRRLSTLGPFRAAVFTADGKRGVTLGSSARLWDAGTGKRLGELEPRELEHLPKVPEIHLAPDGRTLCLATHFGWRGGRVWLWDLETGQLRADIQAKPTALDSPIRPTRLFTLQGDTAQVHDLSGGKLIATLRRVDCPTPVFWSDDGTRLVLGDRANWRLSLWSLESGRRLGTYPGWLCGWSNERLVIFGPAKGRINRVTVVDCKTGRVSVVLKHAAGFSGPWAQSEAARRIATCIPDGSVRVWDLSSGRLLADVRAHDGPVAEVRLSADGRTLATRGKKDGKIRFWQCPASAVGPTPTPTGSE